jgi:uncharacterized membrane protein
MSGQDGRVGRFVVRGLDARFADMRRQPTDRSALTLATVLTGAGVLHLVLPRPYEALIPRRLGDPRPWVLLSGVAEILCGLMVAVPRSRRVGGLASAVLFVGVFPGNVTMAVRSLRSSRASRRAVAWARLPLQVPLVGGALAGARSAPTGRRT